MTIKKHAVVTGAAQGIGAHIALSFARSGATVALLDINEEGLRNTVQELTNEGLDCLSIKVDLSDPHEIEEALQKLFNHHPIWDILVNNAAIVKRGPLLDFCLEDLDLMLNVNLKAALLISRALVPKMIEQKSGKIINITSNSTFYGTPESGPYAISKAALNQLTKTMAIEWGAHNIQVNAVCPGLVNTSLMRRVWDDPKNASMKKSFLGKIPLGRFAEVEDIAPTVLFLASEASNYINGTMITIDNGARYSPS